MRTDYFAHDNVYRSKRDKGESGWDPPSQVETTLRHLMSYLEGISLPPDPAALELGCGAGDVTLALAKRGFRVSGIDISPTAVEWARQKARGLNVIADFYVADICRDPALPIDPVDVVIDGHCLHCLIGNDRAAFFRAAKKYLKPGGYLYIDTMCDEPWSDEAKRRFDPQTRCLVHKDIAYRYLGTHESILNEIGDRGFAVLRWELVPPLDTNDQDILLAVAQSSVARADRER